MVVVEIRVMFWMGMREKDSDVHPVYIYTISAEGLGGDGIIGYEIIEERRHHS